MNPTTLLALVRAHFATHEGMRRETFDQLAHQATWSTCPVEGCGRTVAHIIGTCAATEVAA